MDDHRDTADILALLLKMHGYRVRAAHDGHAALAAVRAAPPDVILLDLDMPGLSGLDLAKQVRRQPGMGQTLLVCLSGYGQDADIERPREAGCDHHGVRPVGSGDLLLLTEH